MSAKGKAMTSQIAGGLGVEERATALAPANKQVGERDEPWVRVASEVRAVAAGLAGGSGSRVYPPAPASKPRRPKSRPGSGHELRGEILAATKALLAATDAPAEVSTRAIADAVGVSTMAIYLHFANKRALLDAVVEEVFAELPHRMEAATVEVGDPLAALCAQGSAYVDFALAHPGLYRYALLDVGSGEHSGRTEQASADSGYRHFVAAVAACMDAGVIARADALEVALDFWTVAHGIAALLITDPSLPGGQSAFVDRVLRSAALGHAALATR
jgi:AcrR family transcriptional regulator